MPVTGDTRAPKTLKITITETLSQATKVLVMRSVKASNFVSCSSLPVEGLEGPLSNVPASHRSRLLSAPLTLRRVPRVHGDCGMLTLTYVLKICRMGTYPPSLGRMAYFQGLGAVGDHRVGCSQPSDFT